MKWLAMFVVLLMTFAAVPLAIAQNETTEATETEVEEPEVEVEEEEVEDETEEVEVEEEEVEVEVEEVEVEVEEELLNATEVEEAGVGPDRPFLWGLERALERIDLALTFNRAAKAKKGLQHARERHLELLDMIQDNKVAAAERGQEALEEAVNEVEENIDTDDSEAELGEAIDVEEVLASQTERLAEARRHVLVKAKGLTEEQKAKLTALIDRFEVHRAEVKVKVEAKKDRIKVKIKARHELTDEEIEALEGELREFREDRRERIKVRIDEIKELRYELEIREGELREEIREITEDGREIRIRTRIRDGVEEVEVRIEEENETEEAAAREAERLAKEAAEAEEDAAKEAERLAKEAAEAEN